MFPDFNSFLARVKPQAWAWNDILGLVSYGTSGQLLTSNGANAIPTFQTLSVGLSTHASGSLPAAATQNVTDIPATGSYLIIRGAGVSSGTATRQPFVTVSTDNGSNFDTTAANYPSAVYDAGTGWADGTQASLIESIVQAATATWTFDIHLFGYQGGPNAQYKAWVRTSANGNYYIEGTYIGSTSAINAVQFKWNGSGSFDAGTYAVYIVR